MLDNILSIIDEKSQQEIDKVLKQNKDAIFALESEAQKNLQEKEEKEKKALSRKIKAEIEEFRQKNQLQVSFELQAERNRMVKAVYSAAEKKVIDVSDDGFKKIIKGFLAFIPKSLEGKISAGVKTANVLKGMSLKYEILDNLKEEGFVFHSQNKDMEIDLRISQVLKQNREQTDPEVISILFN